MDTSKIIRGVVSSGRYTVTAPIVKEDYGLYLQIEGVELPSTYEVDFSNSENNGTSVTMIGNSDGVLIPRQFIDSGKDVFAFLYHVGEDFGRTVYKFRIPNKVRPDRTEEQPAPEEQSVIDQAINALNTAVAQTAQDVISADQSAQNASQDADRAEDARDNAQTYANNASASATSASQSAQASANSATASAQSASQSAQIKSDVEDLVDDARGYASASAQSATASANSASQAQGYAQSASASAQSASGYASQADISANTASNKASEASTSAQTASNKASEASQSASQALSYKTDAESAKTASQTAQGLAESARDGAITAKTDAESAKEDAETARDEAQTIVDGISAKTTQIDSNTENIASLTKDKAPVITDTASGAIASFSDGADDLPLKSLVVDINPVQDLSHGDPSPENICPISGWTGVKVTRTGKNLLNPDISSWRLRGTAYRYINNVVPKGQTARLTFTDKDTSVSVSGISVGFVYNDLSSSLPSTYAWVLNNGSLTSNVSNAAINGNIGAKCQNVFIYPQSEEAFNALFARYNVMVELGTTASEYESYQGATIPISWQTEAGTVYGGKLDVLSGVLTVDRANIASYNGETLPSTWISDRDVYASGTTPTTGAQVVYQLATPIEIQLTPNQINSLYGVNNLWADSGNTTAEYRADTKLYISKKIAEAIASLT